MSGLGWGTRRIATQLEICRKAVKRYQRGAAAGEQVRPKARCLDVAGEELAQKLFVDVAEGNAVVVKDLLAEKGYDAGERTVQRVVASMRREQRPLTSHAVVRRWKMLLLNALRAASLIKTEPLASNKRGVVVGDERPVHAAITYLENQVDCMNFRRGARCGTSDRQRKRRGDMQEPRRAAPRTLGLAMETFDRAAHH